jgi:hypothetical protein
MQKFLYYFNYMKAMCIVSAISFQLSEPPHSHIGIIMVFAT